MELASTQNFNTWASGGIGIHVCLRSICRKAWRFESSLAHLTLGSAPKAHPPPAGSPLSGTKQGVPCPPKLLMN